MKVVYHMSCEDRWSGEGILFSEEHLMRYVFPSEVELLAKNCRLRCLRTGEFLTGREPFLLKPDGLATKELFGRHTNQSHEAVF